MMLQITRRRAAIFLLAVCAVLAVQVTSSATAQSASQDAAKPRSASVAGSIKSATQNVDSQAAAKPGSVSANKPGQEGLTVHGYWKIDVHNPDGKLVTHREFENSLTGGASQLYQLITGQAAAGDMAIVVNNGTTQPEPDICHAGTSMDNCYLVISETSGIGGNLCIAGNAAYCTATLTEVTNGTSGAVMLSGNMLAAQTTVISAVQTFLLTCSFTTSGFATISPTQCFALNGTTGTATQPVLISYGPFTGTTLPTSLPVTVGQTVTFQVVFTFS
jgi:hypothetical protein